MYTVYKVQYEGLNHRAVLELNRIFRLLYPIQLLKTAIEPPINGSTKKSQK